MARLGQQASKVRIELTVHGALERPRSKSRARQDAEHTHIPLPSWAPHPSEFLSTRPCVTNWVEHSFAYQLQPTVARLKRAMESLADGFDLKSSDGREIHWILHGLNQLEEA
ncbi:hypothetical protein F5Y01DRAFT_282754 [Xylaria sp. FL0043]|nr:hypothetical protein F5Y01DRAFT_282754 [Xylaria sp. FL0043]